MSTNFFTYGEQASKMRKEQIDFLKMLCMLQVALLLLHLSHPYKKNANYFTYFPIMIASYNQTQFQCTLRHGTVKSILHFSVQQVRQGYFFGTTISCKFYNISKIMTMFPVFPDHQTCCFKEAFQNKTIILTLSFTGL